MKPKLFNPHYFLISLDTFHSFIKLLLNAHHMQRAVLGAGIKCYKMQSLLLQCSQEYGDEYTSDFQHNRMNAIRKHEGDTVQA